MAICNSFIDQQFDGVIWRLEIDELSNTIFVEIRNEQKKQVSFAALSLVNGEVYFNGLTTPERWLTGMEAGYNGVLLLHNYQSENTPLHKGVMAIDARSGENLWSSYIYAFDHLISDGPVLYDTHIQPRKLFLADIKTGARLKSFDESIHFGLKNNIVVPQLISPDKLPITTLPVVPFGNSIHYLEYNNFIIVSLHTLDKQLKQYLYVIDGADIVYEDLLNTDIQKLQPEAFILQQNRLIYIKNKHVLKVLNL